MSNKRRLRGAAAQRPAERCSFCSRRIGANTDALRLRTGQVVCPACQQGGELPRLACGHMSLPGSLMVADGSPDQFQCAQCSSSAGQFGNARLGLSRRDPE
jgi:hypothetical protein